MNALMNQVQLIGRLGADAEIKTTSTGKKVSTFSLATNERVKISNGEWKDSTQWHTCVLWGEMTKVLENVGKKGAQLIVQGSLNYREYTDDKAIKRTVAEIKVSQLMNFSGNK